MSSLADMNVPRLRPSQENQWGPNEPTAPGHARPPSPPCGGLGPAAAWCRVNACHPRENRLCCTGSLPSSPVNHAGPRWCLCLGGAGI